LPTYVKDKLKKEIEIMAILDLLYCALNNYIKGWICPHETKPKPDLMQRMTCFRASVRLLRKTDG